jgi:CRISPR-associated endonuclease Cas3-HD
VSPVNCLEDIKNKWPLAYAKCDGKLLKDVSLRDHLMLTASLSTCLYKTRFKTSTSNLRGELGKFVKNIDLEDFIYTIGFLHDLGKASMYYYETFIKRWKNYGFVEELTFPYHEHVVSAILEMIAYREEEDEIFKAECDLMAKVISRHHSAMEDRHPLRFIQRSPCLKTSEIVLGFCDESLISFIEKDLFPICKTRDNELCSHTLKDIITLIRRTINGEIHVDDVQTIYKRSIQSFSISGLGASLDVSVLRDAYKLVSTLTGLLIIADNLVAEHEGRSSDEETSRLYVNHWKNELGYYMNKCLEK